MSLTANGHSHRASERRSDVKLPPSVKDFIEREDALSVRYSLTPAAIVLLNARKAGKERTL